MAPPIIICAIGILFKETAIVALPLLSIFAFFTVRFDNFFKYNYELLNAIFCKFSLKLVQI